MSEEIQKNQEQPCDGEMQHLQPSTLWTVEYTYNSYNGVALVRADTADEARQLVYNQSNFNGDPSHINIQVIRQLNLVTSKGILFEYYVNHTTESR